MQLEFINKKLQTANISFEIFGELLGNNEEKINKLKQLFHLMLKSTHADFFTNENDKKVAHEAAIKLQEWYKLAINEVENGSYGKKKLIKIKTKKNTYAIDNLFRAGTISDVYNCFSEKDLKKQLLIKIPRNKVNNDLINNEINTIKKLYTHTGDLFKLITNHTHPILDVFDLNGKQVEIFEKLSNFYTLDEVNQDYPEGINPKDAAWIFRRMLSAQACLHELGYIHGNILPENFLICPDDHNGKLIDFIGVIQKGKKGKIINPKYTEFYAPEVLEKKVLLPSTDIYMSALCIIKLLGGNTKTKKIPDSVPKPICDFIYSLLIKNIHRRFENALDLHEEFGEVLKQIWSKPKFNEFRMKPK